MQFLTLCHKSIFQYKLIRKIEDYSNLQNYYGSLLSVADMNKQGRLKIKDHQIHKYIKMTDESNIKFAIEGFTNLYGHTINIKSSWVDDFMIKCIQYKEHDYVLKFYEYHNTLRYFPHFDVTENLIKSLDNTQILKLIQTLKKRDLIKVSEQNIDQLLLNDDPQVLYQVFRLSIKRNIKLKGEQLLKIARNLLSANISGKFDATQFQESGDVYSLLALSYVQAYLKKYQQSIVTLAKILQTDKTIIKERDSILIDSLKEGVKEDERFSRIKRISPSKQKNGMKITSIKQADQQEHRQNYFIPQMTCEEYVEEFNIYGSNKIFVSASQNASFSALRLNLAVVEQLQPDCILLDHFSHRDLCRILNISPNESQEEKLLGKSKYSKFFVKDLPYTRLYYQLDDNNTYIYRADSQRRVIYFQDQLSVAYYACNTAKMSLLIAQPDQIELIADMASRNSLKDMQDTFDQVILNIKKNYIEHIQNAFPNDGVEEILSMIRNEVKIVNPNIFEQLILYQAALTNKASRSFSKTALFTNQFLTRKIVEKCQANIGLDYRNLFICSNPTNKKEFIEKLVIAGYFVDFTIRNMVLQEKNPFSLPIFENILSQDDQLEYLQMHQVYINKLHDLQNFFIKSILIKDLNQRKLQTFEEIYQEITAKPKRLVYDFNILLLSNIKSQFVQNALSTNYIERMINQRKSQGINQKDVLHAIKGIQEQNYTQRNLSDYLKVMLEANAALGYPYQYPGNLKPQLGDFITSLQAQKHAEKITQNDVIKIAENINFNEITQKKDKSEKDSLFSDDEEEGEFRNFFVGKDGEEVPDFIKNLSLEELEKLSTNKQQFNILMDEHGDIDIQEKNKLNEMEIDDIIKKSN